MSIADANTIATLAKIAGESIGNSTRRIAPIGVAPRSMAASSYCLPIDSIRARTTISG